MARVRAKAAPGRTIAKLELRVAGLSVAATGTVAGDWSPTFVLPAVPGTVARVEALATDDLGAVGVAFPSVVRVQDDPPVARFFAVTLDVVVAEPFFSK